MPDRNEEMEETSLVIKAVFDHRWAILPGYLETILQVVNRQGGLEAALAGRKAYEDRAPSLPPAPPGLTGDQLAVIPIIGPIFPRATLFSSISGGTSISRLTAGLKAALEDPTVAGIVLSIDSPGGEVTGVSEFAQAVYDARGKKPITAYVQGMAASAAYWIASAADEIVLADVGEVGSIGVVAAYSDDKEAQKKRGVVTHEIVSSQSPHKRPDVSTEAGRAQVQEVVDAIAAVFVATVARNRKVSEGMVLETFGQGALFVGQKAVGRKMADRVGTFDSVVQAFEVKMSQQNQTHRGGFPMSAQESIPTKEAPSLPATTSLPAPPSPLVTVSTPVPPSAEEAVAREAAVVATERERIRAIESVKAPGMEAFMAAHKWDAGMTRDKMSALILEEQERQRQAKGAAYQGDALDLAKHAAAVGRAGDLPESSEQDVIFHHMLAGANSKRG